GIGGIRGRWLMKKMDTPPVSNAPPRVLVAADGGARDWQSAIVRLLVVASATTYFGGEPEYLDLWSNSQSSVVRSVAIPLWVITAIGAPVWAWARLVRARQGRSHPLLALDLIMTIVWTDKCCEGVMPHCESSFWGTAASIVGVVGGLVAAFMA